MKNTFFEQPESHGFLGLINELGPECSSRHHSNMFLFNECFKEEGAKINYKPRRGLPF